MVTSDCSGYLLSVASVECDSLGGFTKENVAVP